MPNTILENYLKQLETDDHKIIGMYEHGSAALGYADGSSDVDLAVVWQTAYPPKAEREQLCNKLNFAIERQSDQDHKASDYFTFEGVHYNISHRIDTIFFNHYADALAGTINEFNIYGLGGFKRGNIIYDPHHKMQEYKDKLVVTDEVIQNFKTNRKNSTVNNLRDIKIAAQRNHIIPFVKNLNYLLTTFGIQLYLENKQFPVVPKWIERDAEKFGWDNELLEVIQAIKASLAMTAIVEKLEHFE